MIAAQELEYPGCLDKYKWFARFLLEGKVSKGLQGLCGEIILVYTCTEVYLQQIDYII